jgi:hypothetical protein
MVQIIALALGCLFIRLMFPENALVGVAVDLQHRCALCSLLNDVVTGDGDILACSEASRASSLVWSRMAPGRFVAVDPWWATRGQTRSMPDNWRSGPLLSGGSHLCAVTRRGRSYLCSTKTT